MAEEFTTINRKRALDMQQEFCNMFGYESNVIWDCYERDDKDALIRKVKLIITNENNNTKIVSIYIIHK